MTEARQEFCESKRSAIQEIGVPRDCCQSQAGGTTKCARDLYLSRINGVATVAIVVLDSNGLR